MTAIAPVADLDQQTFEKVHGFLVSALLAQLRHYDGTEPCKRWSDDRLERVAAETVQNAMHSGVAFAIYPAAAIDAKAALKDRAKSYESKAREFAGLPEGQRDENTRWHVAMNRDVAAELRKVADSL